jgi:filamentous hemagglutinin
MNIKNPHLKHGSKKGASRKNAQRFAPRLKPLDFAVALAIAHIAATGSAIAQTTPPARAVLPSGATVVQGANAPKINQQTMTIDQTAPRAIINWDSFNIAPGHSVRFNQAKPEWAILNRVVGNERSILQGVLQADGQVFLLNRNGILIGNGAQINVHTFLGSTLTLTDKLFNDGLVSGNGTVPALLAGSTIETAPKGNIQIEYGAVVKSADGGRILFIASGKVFDDKGIEVLDGGKSIGLVENNGELRASNNGQVILAAGDRVFLRVPNPLSTSNGEDKLAGIVVEVDRGGQVANAIKGYIESKIGNISLVGLTVNQMGRVRATTSVERNGSIWLLARDTTKPAELGGVVATQGGDLNLGPQSKTQVLPDIESGARTSIDGSPFTVSTVRLEGEKIHLQGTQNSGAMVYAPGGNVLVRAQTNPSNLSITGTLTDGFAASKALIALDKNASIDVSGLRGTINEEGVATALTGVEVPIERNSIRIELRSEQLADAPLLRDSAIRSQAIFVDARVGTTLINQDSFNAAVSQQTERSVFERMTTGGNVSLRTDGSAVLQRGSRISVAGGSIAYGSGSVQTSRLFDGRNYFNVATAPNDRRYTTISDALPRKETGYIEGRPAGNVLVEARNLMLQSALYGGATFGPQQRNSAPFGGALAIQLFASTGANILADGDIGFTKGDYVLRHSLDVTNNASNRLPDYLPADQSIYSLVAQQFSLDTVPISQQIDGTNLVNSRLTQFTLASNQQLNLAADSNLTFTPGTRLEFYGFSGGTIASSMTSHGGQFRFKGDALVSSFKVGPNVQLDVSGLWLNDRINSSRLQPLVQLNAEGRSTLRDAGSISFAAQNTVFSENTSVNLEAGVYIDDTGRIQGGKAGSLAVGPSVNLATALPKNIYGFGFTSGASVSLQTSESLWFGPNAPQDYSGVDETLFIKNGIANLDIQVGGPLDLQRNITFASGHSFTPSLLQFSLANRNYTVDGAALRALAQTSVLAGWQASPMNLRFRAENRLELLAGSSIVLPNLTTLSLGSRYQTVINGAIVSRAGKVNLTAGGNSLLGFRPDEGIQLRSQSLIDVSGIAVARPNVGPFKLGSVLEGGEVTIDGPTVFFDASGTIRISGSNENFYALERVDRANRYVLRSVASAAGALSVNTRFGGIFAGSVLGLAGGEGLSNGRLNFQFQSAISVENSNFKAPGDRPNFTLGYTYFPTGERQFVLAASNRVTPTQFTTGTDFDAAINGPRPAVTDVNNDATRAAYSNRVSHLRISETALANAGTIALNNGEVTRFDSLNEVSASTSIRIGSNAVRTETGQNIAITAPYVRFGGTAENTDKPNPVQTTRNSSTVSINATRGVDIIGDARIIGSESFVVTTPGHIRLSSDVTVGSNTIGNLTIAGNARFEAAAVYPASQSRFTISAPTGTVTVAPASSTAEGQIPKPYSVNGVLNIDAQKIDQQGNILAPFGQISLSATEQIRLHAGSVTSVSGDGLVTPYGQVNNGSTWLLPGTTFGNSASLSSPTKLVNLQAPSVLIDQASAAQPAAKVNVSGGGDLIASEFISGPLGSRNLFDIANSFALVPSYRDAFAPPASGQPDARSLGSTIRIENGVAGLPAGVYTILPSRYAQLEGAFLIQPVSSSSLGAALPGSPTITSAAGVPAVIGYVGQESLGLVGRKAEWFEVLNGKQIRERMEIREFTASDFFATPNTTAQLVQDAGSIQVLGNQRIALDGNLLLNADLQTTSKTEGQGGRLEIVANRIQIAANNNAQQTSGTVLLAVDNLNRFAAQELVIGGAITGNNLQTSAQSISVDSGVNLSAGSVVLASNNQIKIENNATIQAVSSAQNRSSEARVLNVSTAASQSNSSGAVIAVSANDLSISRIGTVTSPSVGLTVGDGSQILGRSIVVDSTGATALRNGVNLGGSQSTQLGAQTVLIGEVPAGTLGLQLGTDLLGSLNRSANPLISAYDELRAYGNASLGSDQTRSVVLNSAAIVAGAANTNFTISGETITWRNRTTSSIVSPEAAKANTNLTFNATGTSGESLVLGQGNKRVGGFGNTVMQVGANANGSTLLLDGNGQLANSGQLLVQSDRVQGSALGEQTINVTGNLQLTNRFGIAANAQDKTAGAKVTVNAASINLNNTLSYQSGEVNLRSSGDLTIGAAGVIDTSGYNQDLFDRRIELAGGSITATTDSASSKLVLANGAKLDVSSAGNFGGSVVLNTAGELQMDRGVQLNGLGAKGNANSSAGSSLTVDANRGVNLNNIAAATRNNGFNKTISVRARNGDIDLASSEILKSQTVSVAADNGNLTILGQVDAKTETGGSVEFWQRSAGSGTLKIGGNARIEVNGSIGGGDVTLGSSNAIQITGNATIVAGSADGRDSGVVTLRTPRTGAGSGTGVALSASAGSKLTVEGKANTFIEGVRKDLTLASTLGSATPLTGITTDANAFLANASTMVSNAPIIATKPVQVRAGIEINGSAGANLTTNAATADFAATTIGLGTLTVRSTDNLTIAGSISDGINSTTGQVLDRQSWSYRFVAGADLTAANPNAVRANPNTATTPDASRLGVLSIATNIDIRTGTGSIALSAADRILFNAGTLIAPLPKQPASVFTFGKLAGSDNGYQVAPGYFNRTEGARTDGGNVTVSAGGEIRGNLMDVADNPWLLRQGTINPTTGAYTTVPGWNSLVGNLGSTTGFNMHVGSLGGGSVTVVGHEISDLHVASVTAGRVRSTTPELNALEVINKAPLDVYARGNLNRGQFTGTGSELNLRAGGTTTGSQPIHADNPISIIARSDMTVIAPSNATLLPTINASSGTRPLFSTYGVNSSISMSSAGDISLAASALAVPFRQGNAVAKITTPDMLVQTPESIRILSRLTLAPSRNRDVELLAGRDVLGAGALLASTINPDRVSYLRPTPFIGSSLDLAFFLSGQDNFNALTGAVTQPIRIYADRDIGSTSGIASFKSPLEFSFTQPVFLRAGRDIGQIKVLSQHYNALDETRIEAGRDIVGLVNTTLRENSGRIEVAGPGAVVLRAGRDIRFGNNDADTAFGAVRTIGNATLADLPSGGASIVLIAGLDKDPEYQAMLEYYLKPDSDGKIFDQSRYTLMSSQALAKQGINVAPNDQTLWAQLQTLAKPLRDQLARDIFFSELRLAGGPDYTRLISTYLAPTAGNSQPARLGSELIKFVGDKLLPGIDKPTTEAQAWLAFTALPTVQQAEFASLNLLPALSKQNLIARDSPLLRDYSRGYAASARMFATNGEGNIDLVYNSVRAAQGGQIQMMAPGVVCREADPKLCVAKESAYVSDPTKGNVFVGVANPPTDLKVNNLGIFGLGGAGVNVYAGHNIDVNQSRIVTGGGGNLLLWSSGGSIDAGRGSKAAISAPPPQIRLDSNGNVTIDLSNAIQGSGIRAVSFSEAVPAGEVSLYAPKGSIDAGDAGIQGGSINVGAAVILNAENIRLSADPTGGTFTFDSSGTAGTIAPASSGSTGAASAIPGQSQATAPERSVKRVKVILVDFEGFGGVDCKEKPDDPSCKPRN